MLFTTSLIVIFAASPLVFIALFFYNAPYGRFAREGWGPTVGSRAGWVLMELPALAVIAVTILGSDRRPSTLSLLLFCLWEIHYVYRTCIFPLLMHDSGKRFPILIILFAAIFNSLNGYANGTSLIARSPVPSPGFLPDLRFGVGVALFAAGFLTHVLADHELRSLRKPGEVGYRIPNGGLFELISCPNYFGEIVEWLGFALASWSLAGLAFAVFTMANLVPRAFAHREWYISKFPDYPRERKAVIPFVF